jgi:hypothetical protein
MQHDRNAVQRSYGSDIVCGSNGASDASLLILVPDTLSGEVGGTTLAGLEDDRAALISGGFESSDDGGAGSDIDGRDGVVVLLSVVKELQNIIADNAGRIVSCSPVANPTRRTKGSTYTPSFRDRTLFAPGIMKSSVEFQWIKSGLRSIESRSVKFVESKRKMRAEIASVSNMDAGWWGFWPFAWDRIYGWMIGKYSQSADAYHRCCVGALQRFSSVEQR